MEPETKVGALALRQGWWGWCGEGPGAVVESLILREGGPRWREGSRVLYGLSAKKILICYFDCIFLTPEKFNGQGESSSTFQWWRDGVIPKGSWLGVITAISAVASLSCRPCIYFSDCGAKVTWGQGQIDRRKDRSWQTSHSVETPVTARCPQAGLFHRARMYFGPWLLLIKNPFIVHVWIIWLSSWHAGFTFLWRQIYGSCCWRCFYCFFVD